LCLPPAVILAIEVAKVVPAMPSAGAQDRCMNDKDRDVTSPDAAQSKVRRAGSPAEPAAPAPGVADTDVGAVGREDRLAGPPPAVAGAQIVAPGIHQAVLASAPLPALESASDLSPGRATPQRESAAAQNDTGQDSRNIAAMPIADDKPG